MKHSKQKGNLGFSATVKELHRLGLNVFGEIGDLSKIDLIVEHENKLIKLQVKYCKQQKNGFATLWLKKSGPNGYRYTYSDTDVDIFSVYLPEKDKVLFIPSKVACKNEKAFTIRFEPSKNNQTAHVNNMDDFSDLLKILKNVADSKTS